MKILYLTTWDFANEESDGVCKKIRNQIKTFEEHGYSVDIIYIKNNSLLYLENGTLREIEIIGSIKKTPAYFKMYRHIKDKRYDFVYNRFGMFDSLYYRVLRRLHNNGARIIIEIPTYPYTGERNKGLANWLFFKWDEVYQSRVGNIVDRIATYSKDSEIFGIPTIYLKNGIDINDYKQKEYDNLNNRDLVLVAVALLQPYHGFERLLKGMKNYYSGEDNSRKIYFNIIGDGPERSNYEALVREYGLDDYVTFHGRKNNEEMNEIFDHSDIGVCSLGIYKKGVKLSSELKSKEYMARGIPFIYSCTLDIEDSLEEGMFRKYDDNDTSIPIDSVFEFYDTVVEDYIDISRTMRRKAGEIASMNSVMSPILDYIDCCINEG